MAISSYITCRVCKEEVRVMHSVRGPTPTICRDCKEKESDKERTKYLEGLKKLSLEDRIARIEEALYDQPPVRRSVRDIIIG